jgi:hypothetical protein
MFPNFLSADVVNLSEETSIALAQKIAIQAIATPFSDREISTVYVRYGQGNTPIILLHGFDSSIFEFRRLLPLLGNNSQEFSIYPRSRHLA